MLPVEIARKKNKSKRSFKEKKKQQEKTKFQIGGKFSLLSMYNKFGCIDRATNAEGLGTTTIMAPKAGKQPTKGKKEIFEGNRDTLNFYTTIMAASMAIYVVVCVLILYNSTGWFTFLALSFSSSVYASCYKAMASMARPTYSDTGALIDGGIDLNMTSGMAEHLKDLILLTAIVQILSIISNYFWILWLLAPGRAFYMLWTNILAPWIFAEAPEEDKLDPKAQKKLDRKNRKEKIVYK